MDNIIKPIKTDQDYDSAIAAVVKLIAVDPQPNTKEADQLEILSVLIEKYEEKHFPISIPTAIEAIKFRMEQLNLRPTDLIPYLGSASRVSEVLSGKRKLTISMIKSLSQNLKIPEKSLLNQEPNANEYSDNIPNSIFNKMRERGYFENYNPGNKPSILQNFFTKHPLQPSALYRRSKFRTDKSNNYYVLVAWANRVVDKANTIIPATNTYKPKTVSLEYMREIAKFSQNEENGVLNAIEKLKSDGIIVVIEPQLTGMKLDGICILENKTHPVIGLTLRHDRLDNFWFTIMHELAHIALHLDIPENYIYDDFDSQNSQVSEIEKQADSLASEALVDSSVWSYSAAKVNPIPISVCALASELGVHPVIIAGKARYESGKWNYLPNMIKKYKVRQYFKDILW